MSQVKDDDTTPCNGACAKETTHYACFDFSDAAADQPDARPCPMALAAAKENYVYGFFFSFLHVCRDVSSCTMPGATSKADRVKSRDKIEFRPQRKISSLRQGAVRYKTLVHNCPLPSHIPATLIFIISFALASEVSFRQTGTLQRAVSKLSLVSSPRRSTLRIVNAADDGVVANFAASPYENAPSIVLHLCILQSLHCIAWSCSPFLATIVPKQAK